MNLGDLVTKDSILPNMRATQRFPAIEELVNLLRETQRIRSEDRADVLRAFWEREESMSTGLGFGIAIPHAWTCRVHEPKVAFGRSTKGIDFDSLDHTPARFVVLLLMPQGEFEPYIPALARFAKFLNDRGVFDRLDASADAEEILQILRNNGPSR